MIMTDQQIREKSKKFLSITQDAMLNLCVYDRKGCEDLNINEVDLLLNGGHVTMSEIFDKMRQTLQENFPNIVE